MAYEWSREQFDKETGQIEKDYEQAILAAQLARAEAIKMARTRYMTALEFLNANSALPQAMREQINEEMKRVVALPEPVAPELPKSDATKSDEPTPPDRKEVTLTIDAPDSGWSLQILQAKKVKDEIWVLSALQHGRGISATVITPVSDSVFIDAPSKLTVRHFVMNKTWNTTEDPEGVKFIAGVPDLGRDWVLGELLKMRRDVSDQ